jgi:hypothetical protein
MEGPSPNRWTLVRPRAGSYSDVRNVSREFDATGITNLIEPRGMFRAAIREVAAGP